MIVSLIASVTSGIILFVFNQSIKKSEKELAEKNEKSISENILILKSLDAVGKLTMANSLSLQTDRKDQRLAAALEEYEHIQKEMYAYLLNVNARK